LAESFAGVAMIAQLRGHTRLLGQLCNQASLRDVVRERLLAINVFALAHGRHAHIGVIMIRRGTEDRIDGFLLLEHDAEVFITSHFELEALFRVALFDLRLQRLPAGRTPVIKSIEVVKLNGICQGDDLRIGLLEEGAQVGAPLPAATDDRDIDLIAGGDEFLPPEDVPGNEADTSRCGRCAADESAPAHAGVGRVVFFHSVNGIGRARNHVYSRPWSS